MDDKIRILACDDDENVVKAVNNHSKKIVNVEYTGVTDGFKAIELVKENKYDIILMDLLMPKLSGFETVSQITQLDNAKNCYIVALSGDDLDNSITNQGFNTHLKKPITKKAFEGLIAGFKK